VGDEFNGTLIRNTQSILHSMAELSHDLTAFLNENFHGLISRASKMAIRLMLAHHHVCIEKISNSHMEANLKSVLYLQQDHWSCVLFICTLKRRRERPHKHFRCPLPLRPFYSAVPILPRRFYKPFRPWQTMT
jgi:hypothetical protein